MTRAQIWRDLIVVEWRDVIVAEHFAFLTCVERAIVVPRLLVRRRRTSASSGEGLRAGLADVDPGEGGVVEFVVSTGGIASLLLMDMSLPCAR
jgi:hypothetical protein